MVAKNYQMVKPDGTRYTFVSLAVASENILEDVLIRGSQPALPDLNGWEFRGYSTSVISQYLQIRKFKKGFYADRLTPASMLWGYTVSVRQNNLGDEWIDWIDESNSRKFGWFNLYPVRINETDNKYLNALLLNYDTEKNGIFFPALYFRDYLVQVYPDNPNLFLGKAYVAFHYFRFYVSYFVLERSNPITL